MELKVVEVKNELGNEQIYEFGSLDAVLDYLSSITEKGQGEENGTNKV